MAASRAAAWTPRRGGAGGAAGGGGGAPKAAPTPVQCTRPGNGCRGSFVLLQEDGGVAVRLQHHKTEASAGPREWTIQAKAPGGGDGSSPQGNAHSQKHRAPAQADTLAAKAWACLITQAAPLLRAGKETSLLFLSAQGEPLVGHNTLCNIATAQLAAAGLPGQTARSVRAGRRRGGGSAGARTTPLPPRDGRCVAPASWQPRRAAWARRARLGSLRSWVRAPSNRRARRRRR